MGGSRGGLVGSRKPTHPRRAPPPPAQPQFVRCWLPRRGLGSSCKSWGSSCCSPMRATARAGLGLAAQTGARMRMLRLGWWGRAREGVQRGRMHTLGCACKPSRCASHSSVHAPTHASSLQKDCGAGAGGARRCGGTRGGAPPLRRQDHGRRLRRCVWAGGGGWQCEVGKQGGWQGLGGRLGGLARVLDASACLLEHPPAPPPQARFAWWASPTRAARRRSRA